MDAAGVAGVLEVALAAGLLSPDLLSLDLGLGLPYPSAYQPPPLKLTAGAEITRSR